MKVEGYGSQLTLQWLARQENQQNRHHETRQQHGKFSETFIAVFFKERQRHQDSNVAPQLCGYLNVITTVGSDLMPFLTPTHHTLHQRGTKAKQKCITNQAQF